MTVFVLCFLPLTMSLGFWQLERGAQKRELMTHYLAKSAALPKTPDAAIELTPFARLRLTGHYDKRAFLIDNQIHQGQVGYWLVQGFNTRDGQRFLVNRGFVAACERRAQLPAMNTPEQMVSVIGLVWPFTGLVPVLDDDSWSDDWPKRIQRLDVARMSQVANTRPVEVRLEPGQPGVETGAPLVTALSDDKHLGYAATWFGLAAVLLIGYVIFGWKVAHDNSK